MSYISEVVADSPEGFWLLAEQSGTAATPYVSAAPNDLTGTYVGGPTLGGASIIGTNYAVATTGSSCVSLPKPSDIPTSNFTLEFWFEYASGAGVVFRDSTSGAGAGWSLDLSGTNPVVTANGAGHTVTAVTSAALKTGRHHVVLTGDGAHLNLYTDKVLRDTWTNSSGGASMASPFVLGRDGIAATYTPSTFAAFAIYPYVLSQTRVAAHYDAADAHLLGTATSTSAALTVKANVTVPVGIAASASAALAFTPGFYTLRNVGTAVSTGAALAFTVTQTFRPTLGLVLSSSTVVDVEGPLDTPDPRVTPIHVVSPSVPTPTLVDGRPQ